MIHFTPVAQVSPHMQRHPVRTVWLSSEGHWIPQSFGAGVNLDDSHYGKGKRTYRPLPA